MNKSQTPLFDDNDDLSYEDNNGKEEQEHEGKANEEADEECCVCLGELAKAPDICTLRCHHQICGGCFRLMVSHSCEQEKNTILCPLCRRVVSPI